jgi:hypothetical protein
VNWGRNIFVDLIDKKLWPIAALLLLALVAVPVLISKPAAKAIPGDTAAQKQVAPPAGLPAPGTAVTLANNDVGTERVAGPSHDPFKQASGTVATATTGSTIGGTTATTATTSATSGTGAATSGGATPGSFATGTTGTTTGVQTGTGTTDTTTTPAVEPEPRTQVILRFGVSQGSRPQRSVDALTALPSATRPLFVYLGSVVKNTRAVFLVSADAVPTGDGRCSPDKKVCSQIELRAGDTEYFDVKTSKGTVQYQLDVVGLHKVT